MTLVPVTWVGSSKRVRLCWLVWRGSGTEHISLKRPHVWFVLGARGSGKSSLLEVLAELHLELNHTVVDLFGSKDGEGLAWLRSKWVREEGKRVLLLCSDGADVRFRELRPNVDLRSWKEFSVGDVEDYDLIISANPLYGGDYEEEFSAANRVTDKLYRRLKWRKLTYAIVREASNLLYSRLKLADNQTRAKAEMTYLLREGRHVGLSLGLDSLRWHSVDIDIRSLTDYLVIKRLGSASLLPDGLSFLFGYVSLYTFMSLPPNEFFLHTQKGNLAFGMFPYPEWHKEEGEDILRAVGLEVEGVGGGAEGKRPYFLTDGEHAEIVSRYAAGESMERIAETIARSSATVNKAIRDHNRAVEEYGFCPRCSRAKSKLCEQLVAVRKPSFRQRG